MKQKILLLGENRSNHIWQELKGCFDLAYLYQTSDAVEYFKSSKPDLMVLNLEKFERHRLQSYKNLRNLLKDIPILVLCDELDRSERIEINRISNTYAFELGAEERDLKNYLLKSRFRNAKARNFLRYPRSRNLKLCFDNREISAHFIDYSQTGAQIQYSSSVLHSRMRVRVEYHSQTAEQIRQIESYVVWAGGSSRAGIQFLAVR